MSTQPYPFLGLNFCSRAWRHFTGVSGRSWNKVVNMVQRGVVSFERKQSKRPSPRRDEMFHAMWSIIQDLHHRSPYARLNNPDKWCIPFHHHVLLWRLIQQLHAARQKDSSKPAIFTKEPQYGMFRMLIASLAFKNVIFHRMVDIGCQYFHWKCSSVALELRCVWQNALAEHQVIYMDQTRCYAIDRARAASQYPAVELYMATR